MPMPARSRSCERTPSAATSSRAAACIAAAESYLHTATAAREAGHRVRGDDLDPGGHSRIAQGADHHRVHHHMGEGLPVLVLPVESKEERPHGIARAAVGDDHFVDRLGRRCDRGPHIEPFEHPASGRRDRRGARVAPDLLGWRRIDQNEPEVGRRTCQGQGQRQPDMAATGNQDVSRHRIVHCVDLLSFNPAA